MALWAIADLHLSFGEDKPMEIFRGWDNYLTRLEENWKSLVAPEDTVVVAGDISWAMKLENTLADFRFIDSLPGRKIFIKGNHDYWWETLKKMRAYIDRSGLASISILMNDAFQVGDKVVCGTRGYSYDCPSDEMKILLREAGRLRLSLDAGARLEGERVVFLHYPPVYGDYVCEEIVSVLHEYDIKRCYYGHVHGYARAKAVTGLFDGIEYRMVACDGTGFAPVPVY